MKKNQSEHYPVISGAIGQLSFFITEKKKYWKFSRGHSSCNECHTAQGVLCVWGGLLFVFWGLSFWVFCWFGCAFCFVVCLVCFFGLRVCVSVWFFCVCVCVLLLF